MADFKLAFRSLVATPVVSAVAVLSLALGIGANTAIFSILNSLLLKPLPVHRPDQLIALGYERSQDDDRVNYGVWKEIRDRRLMGDAFAWASDNVNTSSAGETAFLEAIWASGRFFDALGISAAVGRTFGVADDRRGGGADGPVVVISHGLWQRQFGGASDVIGRSLTFSRVPFTIVGVLPSSFFGLSVGSTFDVILPLETEPLLGRLPPRLDTKNFPWLQIAARLAPDSDAVDVTKALQLAQPQIRAATMPGFSRALEHDAYLRSAWIARPAATGSSRLRSRYAPALFALLAIVAVVLLIACANIANLQLARCAARRYELSLRTALGASRLRLVRQLLTESLVLSTGGAVLGFGIAQVGSRLLVQQLSTWASTPFLDLSTDWRVLSVTGVVTIATVVFFGTVPAWLGARVDPIEAIKQQSRSLASGSRAGLGGILVSAQVALSLLLVFGAGLFLRSFVALAYRDLGFDRSRVLVAILDPRGSAVPPTGRSALYERVREAIEPVPDLESVATSMATPLGSAGVRVTPDISVPGDAALVRSPVRILTNPVSPGWFRTFGTRLLAGRDFESGDRLGATNVVVVNQAFARRYLGGVGPLGQLLVETYAGTDRRQLEIVGLVEDAAFTSVRDSVEPTLYRPLAQEIERWQATFPTISVSMRMRPGASPGRLKTKVIGVISGVDPALSVTFRTVNEELSAYYIRERLLAWLSGFFGVVALLLAALGLYGVTAYAVARRRTEIGIRMALGATPIAVARLVLSRVATLTAVGVAIGAVASLWASKFVAALLYGLEPRDPATLAAAAVVLGGVAVVAGLVPAHRASRVDPAEVLRDS